MKQGDKVIHSRMANVAGEVYNIKGDLIFINFHYGYNELDMGITSYFACKEGDLTVIDEGTYLNFTDRMIDTYRF